MCGWCVSADKRKERVAEFRKKAERVEEGKE